jgi:Xaa-Pro aminopeptidase
MSVHAERVARLRPELERLEVEALLVTNPTNVRYLTGFSGTNGQVVVCRDEVTFFTDPRYRARAGSLVQDADIVIYDQKLTDVLPGYAQQRSITRIGVEAGTMTLAERDTIGSSFMTRLIPTTGLVEDLRRSKDEIEIEHIRRACEVADDAFRWVLDRLVPGITEREVALDLEVRMRLSGADAVSFPPIVGSGPLSAHIHHSPSERPLEKGDLVLLDLGALVEGYCSDMTRTVILGTATEEQIALYALVLEAQEAAIEQVAPGVDAAYVDRRARSIISDAGHGDTFAHGLGHGVGLDIHEAPTLKKISEDVLAPGDVVTVEPGVYLEGQGGVRIEDSVLVTQTGYEVLSNAPKNELIQL